MDGAMGHGPGLLHQRGQMNMHPCPDDGTPKSKYPHGPSNAGTTLDRDCRESLLANAGVDEGPSVSRDCFTYQRAGTLDWLCTVFSGQRQDASGERGHFNMPYLIIPSPSWL